VIFFPQVNLFPNASKFGGRLKTADLLCSFCLSATNKWPAAYELVFLVYLHDMHYLLLLASAQWFVKLAV